MMGYLYLKLRLCILFFTFRVCQLPLELFTTHLRQFLESLAVSRAVITFI